MKSKYENIRIHVNIREAHHQLSALAWISMPHGLCIGPAYSFLPPPFPPQHLTASLILDSRKIMRMKPAASSSSERASALTPQNWKQHTCSPPREGKLISRSFFPRRLALVYGTYGWHLTPELDFNFFWKKYLKHLKTCPLPPPSESTSDRLSGNSIGGHGLASACRKRLHTVWGDARTVRNPHAVWSARSIDNFSKTVEC